MPTAYAQLCAPYCLRQYGLCATLLPPVVAIRSAKSPYCLQQYGLCATLLPPVVAIRSAKSPYVARQGSIRALATLLPPCGGNTLRHAGYVLTALRAYARRFVLPRPNHCP